MINPKEIENNIIGLFAESKDEPYVVGNGILTHIKIAFSKKKIEENKKDIAVILQEIGIDEHPLINLSSLTKYKDGSFWNQLQTIEDFKALELLLACSDACGFIYNDLDTIERNINSIGDFGSLLISQIGISIYEDKDEWLKLIKERVIEKMFFLTDSENIIKCANLGHDLTDSSSFKHK